jgi:GTP-binding protein
MKDDRTNDPLVIRQLEFMGGMASATGWRPPAELPEVAFAGRSNVGKSSLINALLRRKKMARVSNTPGRTREINFFRVNEAFVMADLPGYGYARISKERRAEWRPLIEGYLRRSPMLRGVVQLLDSRREPTEDDLQMLDFLGEMGTPTLVVLTKVDKLSRAERSERIAAITAKIGVDADQLIPFSMVTGEGRNDLAAAVSSLVETAAAENEARRVAAAEAAAAAALLAAEADAGGMGAEGMGAGGMETNGAGNAEGHATEGPAAPAAPADDHGDPQLREDDGA